jgi:hypothetical protein
VDQYDNATFYCTSTGSGVLIINWDCSDGSNCGVSNTHSNNNGQVTSTLVITCVTSNLTVTCAVIQNQTILSSGEPADVEVRLPSIKTVQSIAQLIFIPVPVTYTMTQPETTPPGSEGKKCRP